MATKIYRVFTVDLAHRTLKLKTCFMTKNNGLMQYDNSMRESSVYYYTVKLRVPFMDEKKDSFESHKYPDFPVITDRTVGVGGIPKHVFKLESHSDTTSPYFGSKVLCKLCNDLKLPLSPNSLLRKTSVLASEKIFTLRKSLRRYHSSRVTCARAWRNHHQVEAESGEPNAGRVNGHSIEDCGGDLIMQAEEKTDLISKDRADHNWPATGHPNNADGDATSVVVTKKSVADLTLPEMADRVFNLVPYVNRSETLQKLVQLGVDLSVVQQVDGIPSLLLRSKFKQHIVPYIQLLADAEVPLGKLGYVFTVNPHILTQPLEELEAKIGYLLHMKFELFQVGEMISRAPVILLMSPVQLDEKLGFLQQAFDLSGNEVRAVAVKYPKLLPYKKDMLALNRFHVRGFLGFSDAAVKELFLKEPRILVTSSSILVNNFDYIHNTMLIPHDQILLWPGILLQRLHNIKNRHMFLLERGRAQYNPDKENYVSMRALVVGIEDEFCRNVAKCKVEEFHDFLKTL